MECMNTRFRYVYRFLILCIASWMLASCGGGGGGPTTRARWPPESNNPPPHPHTKL